MPRAGLSRELVVGEAAVVADEVGYDHLTLAAVAARFDVRLPSLYKHVGGLDDLRSEMAALAVEELAGVVARAAVGRSGLSALRALAAAYRRYACEHPGRYAATLRAPDPENDRLVRASDEVLETVLAVLAGYGLRGPAAIDATRALRSALHGWVDLERSGGFGLPQDVDRSFDAMIEGFDRSLRQIESRDNVSGGPSTLVPTV